MIFTGKRVALIGPAPIDKDYKDIINSCDVVVRINDAFPIRNEVLEKTGDRCEVLYIWRKVRPSPSWYGVKEFRLKPDAIFKDDWLKEKHEAYKERLAVIDPQYFYGLSEALGTRVNTGMVAIAEIVSHKPEYLFITGITFYQSAKAYHRGYVSEVVNNKISKCKGNFAKHRQRPQLDYFIEKIYPKDFVHCDDQLKAICERLKGSPIPRKGLGIDRNIQSKLLCN